MDNRCLYGHRVPAAFTFAIQSRNCPTCGAPTVTITGYQAARKLTTEVGLEAVAAFSAIRVLESEWILTPVAADGLAMAAGGAALGADSLATPPSEDEEVVVEDATEQVVSVEPTAGAKLAASRKPIEYAASPPREARPDGVASLRIEPVRTTTRAVARPEPRSLSSAAVATPVAEPVKDTPRQRGSAEIPTAAGFDHTEEDFFKQD